MKMTVQQQKIHEEAVELMRVRKDNDSRLVQNFIWNQKQKVFACFGKADLFLYLVGIIGMSEPVAATFKTW
jgi:hypothetical protein